MTDRRPAAPRRPTVPGYRLGSPVGFGAAGAVWAAHDDAGRAVVVSILDVAAGERGTAQLRRLGTLRATTHPHLAAVRDVVGLDARRCALVSEVVTGPSLATVHAARGPLPAGETAGLLAAIGSALGHLHERGIIHGDVSPANVLVTDGGVPVLVDLAGEVTQERGTAGFVPPERRGGSPAGAAGDVWALAQLVTWAAHDAEATRRLVAPALDPEPSRRPGARDLAALAVSLADAAALVLPDPADLAQAQLRATAVHDPTALVPRRRPRRRHGRRPVRRAAVAVAVLAVAVGAGAVVLAPAEDAPAHDATSASTPAHGGPAAVAPSAGASAPDGAPGAAAPATTAALDTAGAAAVVRDLFARRDQALAGADARALEALTVRGSPAARKDEELLGALRGAGLRPEGLRTEVLEVSLLPTDPPDGDAGADAGARRPVVAQVTTRQGPYTLAPARTGGAPGTGPPAGAGRTSRTGPTAGPTGHAVAAQPERCVSMTLTGPAPWRVVSTAPCTGP
ncbi:serine/threonine-protein kinase [Georgenia sp. SYP-B2076]|uniref:serine/threonine-protein kinase n=1 Tax=Georgenia sp. SYP-B2076 TaxID=2495881 RepID=UPI000F8CC0C2|nr:protein kinase [Georgenia sp. SYP-B2076]